MWTVNLSRPFLQCLQLDFVVLDQPPVEAAALVEEAEPAGEPAADRKVAGRSPLKQTLELSRREEFIPGAGFCG